MFDPNDAATNRRLLVLHAGFRELLQTVKAAQPMISGMLESIENNVEQSLKTISGDYAQWMVDGCGPRAYASWLQYPDLVLRQPKDIPIKAFKPENSSDRNPAMEIADSLKPYFQNKFDFLNFKLPVDIKQLPHYSPDDRNPEMLQTGLYNAGPFNSYSGHNGWTNRMCVVLKTEGTNRCILIRELTIPSYSDQNVSADFVYVPIEEAWVKHPASSYVNQEEVEAEIKKIKEQYQFPTIAKGTDLTANELSIFLNMELGALRQKFGGAFDSKLEDFAKHVLEYTSPNGITLYRTQYHDVILHWVVWVYRRYAIVCKLQTQESDTRSLELREYNSWKGGGYNKLDFDSLDAYTRAGLSTRILDDLRKAYPLDSEETEQADTEQAES